MRLRPRWMEWYSWLGRALRRSEQAESRPAVHLTPLGDPFESVWDEEALRLQRALLVRVLDVAKSCDIRLFLFWGTLLGHVREGRILDWDDDVDLAFFDSGDTQCATLRAALQSAGMGVFDHDYPILKVYDPATPGNAEYPWSWPFVDIFPYSAIAADEEPNAVWPVPRNLILPGKPAVFEGIDCWEPQFPAALLDRQYAGWRTTEQSPKFCHRKEMAILPITERPIVTDSLGRKTGARQSPDAEPNGTMVRGEKTL